ncbi:MAG: S49 family peptidase [Planctomycetes bacterium]|nr:S49 family peptidase [Planctomycetota bacterium]
MKNPERICRACLALALAVTASLSTACVPRSVTLSLGDGGRRLMETTVHRDAGSPRDKVALIDVRGLITESATGSFLGPAQSVVDSLVARLRVAAQDRAVKAVIIRINSPGGTVTGSDIAYREIRRFRRETGKPVVASLGEVAASGGYYTALAADEILTMPTTLTASIGVIIPSVNVSQGLSMIGIFSNPIVSGPNKAMGDPLTPQNDAHVALLQGIVDEFYARFKGLVIERRPGLEAQYVAEATDGRVVTGARAVEIGLADGEGDLYDAFDRAKALAGIERAKLVKYHSMASRPRSAYASLAQPAPRAEELAGFRLEIGSRLGGVSPANAYYLWAPALP